MVKTTAEAVSSRPSARRTPATRAAFDDELGDLALDEREIRAPADVGEHGRVVAVLVLLRARSPHGRTSAAIEKPELDPARIRVAAHDAAQSVDLADEMPLREPADRGIARHPRHGGRAQRDERDRAAHPRRGESRLASGVAGAHDDDVCGVCHLLSDAKRAEDPIIQIFVPNLAGDLSQGRRRPRGALRARSLRRAAARPRARASAATVASSATA